MNQLHFFPVRSAKAMRREQRGTVSVRLLNIFNAFNAFKAFPEPNRARRMCILARFYGVLLAGMFGLVLTGCGGSDGIGGGGDPASQNFLAVFNMQALAGEDYILVDWTNPALDNIDGFVITTRRDDASDGGTTKEFSSTVADVSPRAWVSYNITDLTNNITYSITVAVRYKNGIIVTSPPVSSTTGAGVGTDIDGDGEDDDNDNCPLVANADQANTDNADDGGDACDDDDDNDGVADTADTCPIGVTGWTSNASADHDGDGCRDTDEDSDDDNDGVADTADTCPTGVTGWTSNASADHDGDGCRDTDEDSDDDNDGVADPDDAFVTDACASIDTDGDGAPDKLAAGCTTGVNTTLTEDVDDNNNGLIEIHTLDDLARLRDDLNGDGADDDRIPEITSVGSMGCPDDDDGGCVGYELTRSLNFGDADSYAAGSGNPTVWTTGSGWQPIGSCSAVNDCTSYTGIFDGGGYRIADLFISASNTAYGVGLFGALTGGIQNLHLLNANVSGGATTVAGGLVGYGRNADIRNAPVSGGSVAGKVAGGLVGDGRNANIRNASVSGVDVFGSVAGGLVGNGGNADIRNASVSGGSVIGRVAGGLVGNGENADIRNASVSGGNVIGNTAAGGLVGQGLNADIGYASVSGVDVSGPFSVGGLVGDGEDADIRYASVSGGSVFGGISVGGLIGDGENAGIGYASVSGVNVSGVSVAVGGLVGYGEDADIRYAYVLGGSVSGGVAGGLVGNGEEAQINYSYAAPGLVSGENAVGGLIGNNSDTVVTASYWDTVTTEQPIDAGHPGGGKTTLELQSPTDFTGMDNIYADWGNAWCNPNTGAESTTELPAPFIRVWDLGTSSQYPALNCLPGGLSAQDR